jgi:tRNA threonylcarbamoyladenosine biosynthesis protein TsaB
MIVLGIEGALGVFSAALARDEAIRSAAGRSGNVALEDGLNVIAEAMAAANVQPAELDRIAVGNGPGGFTGLRITIAYAKSLAQAWRVPLVAVSSFDALEHGRTDTRALSVVSGRAGVISARYRDGGASKRASGRTAEVLRAVLPAPGEPLPVYGASEDVLALLAEGGFIVEARPQIVRPPAAAVALAGERTRPGQSIHEVRADYGEAPAAKPPTFHRNPESS